VGVEQTRPCETAASLDGKRTRYQSKGHIAPRRPRGSSVSPGSTSWTWRGFRVPTWVTAPDGGGLDDEQCLKPCRSNPGACRPVGLGRRARIRRHPRLQRESLAERTETEHGLPVPANPRNDGALQDRGHYGLSGIAAGRRWRRNALQTTQARGWPAAQIFDLTVP